MKAYRLMEEEFKLPPVAIHLYKHIPDGAGLGGGSSDATSVAKILNSMFALGLSEEEIAVRVKRLGADCPFLPTTGRWQPAASAHLLEPVDVDLRGYTMIVVKPDVSVPTAAAYAGVTPRVSETDVEKLVAKPVGQWKGLLVNDFEESIFPSILSLRQSSSHFMMPERSMPRCRGRVLPFSDCLKMTICQTYLPRNAPSRCCTR